jgi:hypothetical protein
LEVIFHFEASTQKLTTFLLRKTRDMTEVAGSDPPSAKRIKTSPPPPPEENNTLEQDVKSEEDGPKEDGDQHLN